VTAIAAPMPGELIVGTASGNLLLLKQKKEERSLGTKVFPAGGIAAGAIGTSGPVNDIMRDSAGRLWCAHRGSQIGDRAFSGSVAMLDEGKWTVWHSDNSQLPARPVTTLCEVRPGLIWAGVDWHDPYVGGSPPPETGLFALMNDDWENVNPPSFWTEPQRVLGSDGEPSKEPIYNESARRISLIRVDDLGRVWVGSHRGLACFEALSET